MGTRPGGKDKLLLVINLLAEKDHMKVSLTNMWIVARSGGGNNDSQVG